MSGLLFPSPASVFSDVDHNPVCFSFAKSCVGCERLETMTIEIAANRYDAIGHIQFAKPPFNYACPELLRQIADQINAFDADPAVRCMLLSSDGKSFCAGADLAGDESIASRDGMTSIASLYEQAIRIFARKKPMVAAIQGAAIGAGLGLALTADFRVASPTARLSANFVRLGFHPGFALTQTLPRLVGEQKAAWMMLSAARVKPDEALNWGLVDRVSGDDDLMNAASAMAAEIAENAPLALVAVRQTLIAGLPERLEAAMRHEHAEQTILKRTADYAEGVASVFERRDANFLGR
jgi:enoyl-CoA hydratase/carnithine racemase